MPAAQDTLVRRARSGENSQPSFPHPSSLVIDGRCFVPGTDDLIAMDIYNGRILWERAASRFGTLARGLSRPVTGGRSRAVYALQDTRCLVLDPTNGTTLKTFHAPLETLESDDRYPDMIWEYLAVTEELVVGTLGQANIKREWWSKACPENRVVFACDKSTGDVVWSYRRTIN